MRPFEKWVLGRVIKDCVDGPESTPPGQDSLLHTQTLETSLAVEVHLIVLEQKVD